MQEYVYVAEIDRGCSGKAKPKVIVSKVPISKRTETSVFTPNRPYELDCRIRSGVRDVDFTELDAMKRVRSRMVARHQQLLSDAECLAQELIAVNIAIEKR